MLHPDHRVVGFATIDGLVSARDHLYMPGLAQIGLLVWRPETLYLWSAEQPDHVEDIGDTLDQKTAALREHHSQFDRKEDLGEWVRARAQQQGQAAGHTAGEAFKQIAL
jgi:LmbE family N-acetylglucosaminyl deacetylase